MSTAISFFSEHTAEFALVPKLTSIFKAKYNYVTPIYPWMMREGNSLSRIIHNEDMISIIGLYPRRIKLNNFKDSNAIIKINREIILGAKTAFDLGIPMIAGCPLVRNFWELGDNPVCLWIDLNQCFCRGATDRDIEIVINNLSDWDYKDLSNIIFRNNNSMLDYLFGIMQPMNIDSAIDSFRRIRNAQRGDQGFIYHYFGLGGSYKPVYFLLKEIN
ncbi:MAG: hypothetical protein JW712_04485 [Dehalococcoidales bacterium]|nr:hypothetical protein [Dehalococcoidales bacterium]